MLPGRPWRFAQASVVGSSHLRNGTPCQDASACEFIEQAGASALVAVVSDGAGSAPYSQFGSRTACELVLEETRAALAAGAGLEDLGREFALGVLERIQVRLARVARHVDRPERDFACTLLFAVLGERRSLYAQIGDGAIVVSPDPHGAGAPESYGWVFWPQQGEYLNQTCFVTEARAHEHLEFAAWDGVVEELALFSDGLQGLVLDGKRKVAHARFFAPMFGAVRGAAPGRSQSLSHSLARFLASKVVESRTDDDKSLVLASRRVPEPRAVTPSAGPAATAGNTAMDAPVASAGPSALRAAHEDHGENAA